ncbi:hypothetical protein [Paraburkholderia xenovorans]
MSKLKNLEELFGGRHFDWEIIILSVRVLVQMEDANGLKSSNYTN